MLKAAVHEPEVAIAIPFNERKGAFIHLELNGVTTENLSK
jgi:hypothetical protein